MLDIVKVYNLFAFGDPLEQEKGTHEWYDGAIVAMMILMVTRNVNYYLNMAGMALR